MMLGAQRAVLVPFRFPAFGVNLPMIRIRAGSGQERLNNVQSAKPALLESQVIGGLSGILWFLRWWVLLGQGILAFVIWTRPYGSDLSWKLFRH